MAIRQVTRAGVGLVVGIIILGALVLGGLWLVRERGEQARREEAINIADQQLQVESGEDIALNTDEDANKDADKDTAEEATKPTESTETTKPESTATKPEPTVATQLPQTGPEVFSFVPVGLLGFAVVSFIRSRKLVSSQL